MPTPKAKPSANHVQKPPANKIQKPKEWVRPWFNPTGTIIYGPPGVGKTDLAANFPSPYFFIDPQEEGIKHLVAAGRVPEPKGVEIIDTFKDLLNVGMKRASRLYADGIRTAVFDSATGFERLCFDHHCEENFNGDRSKEGFMSFYAGPAQAAQTDWVEFLESLDNLRDTGIDVILIAHAEVKPYTNPMGPDFDRYSAYLDKRVWQQTHRWANPVIFYNYYYDIEKKKGALKAKANVNDTSRMLYTEYSPAFDAKNSFGLPSCIEAGESGKEAFDNLCAAFPAHK